MLAPFGLAGTLTGHVYKNMDAETSRMMDEWSHFYPVVNNNGPNELSPAVEVLVGKFLYFYHVLCDDGGIKYFIKQKG